MFNVYPTHLFPIKWRSENFLHFQHLTTTSIIVLKIFKINENAVQPIENSVRIWLGNFHINLKELTFK